MKNPYLIQRVMHSREKDTNAKGVDRSFGFDYMGSSEFEWGALPAALRVMREHKKKLKVHEGHYAQYDYWVVAAPEMKAQAVEYFEDLFNHPHGKKFSLKETSYLARAYDNDPFWGEEDHGYMDRLAGWWALDADIPWVIFRTEADAEEWLKLILGGKK